MQTVLKPQKVFDIFAAICNVPRPSKKEEKMVEFLKNFATEHHLQFKVDKVGNVLITKPATQGYENRKTVVLQAHMDMVCEKNREIEHDFLKDPIETYVKDGWMHARGTTLGADDGLGIAIALAVLTDESVKHPPLEALFTVDEETGLTGAQNLQGGFMTGDLLINLDSEDEGEIFIGCAGGVQTEISFRHFWTHVPKDYFFFKAELSKFVGGHSGDDINKGHANANKILNRFLYRLANKYEMYLCRIEGGNLHNAIPREASAIFAVPEKHKEDVRIDFNLFASEVREEFAVTEPNCQFDLQSTEPFPHAIDRDTTNNLLKAIHAVFNGVFAMSQDVPGLVETSSNLASIKMPEDGEIHIVTSQRSSILSSRDDVVETVFSAFALANAEIEVGGGYPGWKPNVHSELLNIATETYRELFGVDAKVRAIHAGLECGLFLEKYPHLDMISFGPTLRGVHSPDERLEIATVEKCWKHLTTILERIPEKQS